MENSEQTVAVKTSGTALETREPARMTDVAIDNVVHNMRMAERLTIEVLEDGVDYGHMPGVQGKALFDPGASKIIASFNSYPEHVILHHTETDELVSFILEARIVHKPSREVIATGVGAASSRETKYKYRWVADPENWGYSEAELGQLKTRPLKESGEILYRIKNPEYGELVHTLLVMAAKRAEVDAAKSLPSVGSALRKLLDPRMRKQPDWNSFWGKVAQMGLTQDNAHNMLGVKSIKEWLMKGGTLETAIVDLTEKMAAKTKRDAGSPPLASPPSPPPSSQGKDEVELKGNEQGKVEGKAEAGELEEKDIRNLGQLYQAVWNRWKMQPADIWKAMGYSRQKDYLGTLWEAYLTIKELKGK